MELSLNIHTIDRTHNARIVPKSQQPRRVESGFDPPRYNGINSIDGSMAAFVYYATRKGVRL